MTTQPNDMELQSIRGHTLAIPERELRSQDEIIASWNGNATHPLVSICCAAYNHEGFVRDALDGFLMQETEFPIEILVNDDASSDGTADIIRRYEQRYPLIVKPMYQPQNLYSRGIKPLPQLHARSKGKYIAVCEGDDFWTDPRKLAIQVAFLEGNSQYVLSGHDACVIDDKSKIISDSKLPYMCKRDFSSEEMISVQAWALTLSWVFRNVAISLPPELGMVANGDRFYLSLLGHYGMFRYHADIQPACYRVHQGGVWSQLSRDEQQSAHINTVFWISRYYARIGQKQYAEQCWNIYVVKVLMSTRWRGFLRSLLRILRVRFCGALAVGCNVWSERLSLAHRLKGRVVS